MNWFGNLSTRSKLFWSFGLMLLFLAALVVTALNGLRIISEQNSLVADSLTMENNFNRQRADLLTMMAISDRAGQDALRTDIEKAAKENDVIFGRLKTKSQDTKRSDLVGQLFDLRQQFAKTRDDEVIPLIQAGKIAPAQSLSMGIQRQRFNKMRDIGLELIVSAENQAAQTTRNLVSTAVGISLGALITGLLLAFLLHRLLAVPLREISLAAEQIAVGDLALDEKAIQTGVRHDEVGTLAQTFGRMRQSLGQTAKLARQLAGGDLRVEVAPLSEKDVLGNSFKAMVENLRTQTKEITEAATVLASVATEISASTSELAAGSAETASAVAQTTATVEEVRQTARVSSDKSRLVAESAQNAARIAESGRGATAETADGMANIREQMEAIGQSMMHLSEQTSAIGAIIASVDDLAQQSNLLAVNAAIEAAKAGEQGKGFAVVAGEVKSLADQSKQATTQVRTILNDIQKATGVAVMATEQGTKAVETGVKQAAQAGESIESLAESVGVAAQSATQIAASSQQQLVGMDQMTFAMENIKQASTQNVDGARQLEEAARNLQDLGRKLGELVGRYQIEERRKTPRGPIEKKASG